MSAATGPLADGLLASGLTHLDLWLKYVAVGGVASPAELEAYVFGALQPSDGEHDRIAQALNDHFVEHGGDHPVPYADELYLFEPPVQPA